MKKIYISFVPRADGDLVVWLSNLKEKIVTLGPVLGLTAAQVTSVQEYCETMINAINKVEVGRGSLSLALNAREEAKEKELQQIVDILVAAKRSPAYLDSIGGELRILGTVQTYDPEKLKPTLKADARTGKVVLSFNLQKMNCVSLYARLKGTSGWDKIANDYESPYEDKRSLAVAGQPEIREYMARYFNGREDVGIPSDIVTVTYGG